MNKEDYGWKDVETSTAPHSSWTFAGFVGSSDQLLERKLDYLITEIKELRKEVGRLQAMKENK